MEAISASLSYDDFISTTDGKHIDDIYSTTSIAFEMLQSELIFMKDKVSESQEEVVVHTFQNIGGYLIAKVLLHKYPSPREFVKSSFFRLRLKTFRERSISSTESTHQLASDIVKFMVIGYTQKEDDLINYSDAPVVLNSTWDLIFEHSNYESKSKLTAKLEPFLKHKSGWHGLFFQSLNRILDIDSKININYISERLKPLEPFFFDLTWTRFVYDNTNTFIPFIDDLRKEVQLNNQDLILDDQIKIQLELCIWLLETTSHNVRDKVTHILLEYGTSDPLYILEKLKDFSTTKHLYVFERLSGILYGICLRKQNDNSFINEDFKKIAQEVYNLQFSKNPNAPSYHYIIIDSFKHIIDLAIYKKVLNAETIAYKRVKDYRFEDKSLVWKTIEKDDLNFVQECTHNWHASHPDPLGKDFVTYTIIRLLKEESRNEPEFHVEATANIYKRIIANGFVPKKKLKETDQNEMSFINGENLGYSDGKIDRLGKKYSWNAFFEYAGYLLNNNNLNSYYDGDSYISAHYERLSDVDIEVSHPDKDKGFDIEQLYKGSLIAHKNNSPSWTQIEQYSEIKTVWNHKFKDDEFALLSGSIHDKPDDSYDVESYLLVNSVLVKKEDIEGKESLIINRNYKWQKDLHTDGGSLSHVYFGELYWADTIPELKYTTESIETDEKEIADHRLSTSEVFGIDKEYEGKKPGDIVQVEVNKKVIFDCMPAVMEYLWETDSNVYPHLRCDVPCSNIGKYLKLTTDAKNFRILDNKGKIAYRMIKHDYQKRKKQSLNYLRKDLLKKYLNENNLVLMYQIKQHTFDRLAGDGSGDFRGMQFFFPEI